MESKVAALEVEVNNLKEWADRHNSEVKDQLHEIFERTRVLERMVWIAIGSTAAFGTIATYFGGSIMKLLTNG